MPAGNEDAGSSVPRRSAACGGSLGAEALLSLDAAGLTTVSAMAPGGAPAEEDEEAGADEEEGFSEKERPMPRELALCFFLAAAAAAASARFALPALPASPSDEDAGKGAGFAIDSTTGALAGATGGCVGGSAIAIVLGVGAAQFGNCRCFCCGAADSSAVIDEDTTDPT